MFDFDDKYERTVSSTIATGFLIDLRHKAETLLSIKVNVSERAYERTKARVKKMTFINEEKAAKVAMILYSAIVEGHAKPKELSDIEALVYQINDIVANEDPMIWEFKSIEIAKAIGFILHEEALYPSRTMTM